MAEQERYLEMAGLRIRVSAQGDLSEDPGILENFLTAPGPVDHSLRAEIVERIDPPQGTEVHGGGALRVYHDGATVIRCIGEVARDPANAYIRVARQGAESVAQYRRKDLCQGVTSKLLLNALDLPHLLAEHDGILLHAAFIEHEGRAILFTAPSETGKSTQARLWCEHMGAALVNGDRAAVRVAGDRVLACGVPFAGSSTVRRNVTMPLEAIVYLSQAPENSITRLGGRLAFRRVWEGCTVNVWEREDVERATATVSGIIGRTPVYHLACTPDRRAVELLKNTMEVEK
ncbi:MAG: hypothetical protein IJ357_06495 [Oscillospiraceae bacterium]|nr:hypothetical protein [Oscillospiraceae bacterium]